MVVTKVPLLVFQVVRLCLLRQRPVVLDQWVVDLARHNVVRVSVSLLEEQHWVPVVSLGQRCRRIVSTGAWQSAGVPVQP